MKHDRTRIRGLVTRLLANRPAICTERATLITESHNETEGQAPVVRRARALQKILERISIYIGDGELIVGNQASKPRSAPIFPEFSTDWLESELDTLASRSADAFDITDEQRVCLKHVFAYWKGQTTKEHALAAMPVEVQAAQSELAFLLSSLSCGIGHIAPDYQRVLTHGLRSILHHARQKLAESAATDPKKMPFYEAVIISAEASIAFAQRFHRLALELSERTHDPHRKTELLRIAAICDRVPAYPARDFYEALQAFWFVHLIIQLESNGHSISPGRFDQYMAQFYEQDIQAGTLTPGQAQELVECLWVKFNEINKVRDKITSQGFGGYPMFQNLVLGGQRLDGVDATNELSHICLTATANLCLPQPSLSVRWHTRSPLAFQRQAVSLAKLGTGMPSFFNDDILLPLLKDMGCSLEDARDYAPVGCIEVQPPGKTQGYYPGGFLNLAKCLEVALTDGRNSGEQSSPAPDSFQALLTRFEAGVARYIPLMVQADNIIEQVQARMAPSPFLSLLVDDCLVNGESVEGGGARYNFTAINGVGLANVADALAAMKKLVYEEKRISERDLLDALRVNFEGKEYLRQMLLNRAPKYGNDEDYVDLLARDVSRVFCREVLKHTNARGGSFQPGYQTVSMHALFAGSVGATPDGRKREMLLADGGVSPAQGRDKHGPTAVIKSVAKLDHLLAHNGTLLNVKFTPTAVAGDAGTENVLALIRTFFQQGGQHIQFNVVSAETLRDAQTHPENYGNLVIRVAGFSVFFTTIDRVLQEDIIARTEHQCVG
jgi:pyruvate formate-lyase/glycerol dehydratase family glycyl radical enzyme